jgi:hypothetical protein
MKLKLLFALLIVQLGFAQHRTCGMQQQMDRIMSNPELKQQYLDMQQQFESEIQRLTLAQEARNGQSVNSTNVVLRIPVAVHYPSVTATAANTALQSCLKALAQRQVNILNADYNGTNTDISNWATYSSLFPGTNTGVMSVSFELATQNHPSGSGLGFPTNGNVAVTFGTDFLSNADTDATWAGYCNLVVRNISGGILGYSPLGGSPSSGMTVVIDNNAFGATMTTSPATCTGYVPGAPYNLGRTLTHELGHFFNLDHTFASCDGGNCATSGDRVCDTPSANQPRYDCEAPDSSTQPANGCGPIQLTMNYMDYVEDSCMYMFTTGQATRMTAWYNTIQSQIRTNVLGNTEYIATNFAIAPNPNKGLFSIQLKEITDYSVTIIDALGRVVYENEFNQNTNLVQDIKIDNTLSGMYFVTIENNGASLTKKIIVE